MYEDVEDIRQTSYWPSVSDLFMTLFILALVGLGTMYYVFLPTSDKETEVLVEALGSTKMESILNPTNRIRAELRTPLLASNSAPSRIIKALSETSDDAVAQLKLLNKTDTLTQLKKELATAQLELKAKEGFVKDLKGLLAQLENDKKGLEHALNDKPPIIKISEDGKDGTKKFRFPRGSADLDKAFKDGLRDGGFKELADEITKRNKTGLVAVDTLEIIGHTDGVPISKAGNLDEKLPTVLTGELKDFRQLHAGSNNDLGLLRALAIKAEWAEFIKDRPDSAILKNIDVRCYSAGQTVPEGVTPGDPDLNRADFYKKENTGFRRIEIRLTKLRDQP